MSALLRRWSRGWLAFVPVLFTITGCDSSTLDSPVDLRDEVRSPAGERRDSRSLFLDEVSTNVELPTGLNQLEFIRTTGEKIKLSDYVGRQNVMLVFTQGFSGMLCPFCTAQTARLVANYQRFQELETEVLVVYPGPDERVHEFIEAARTTDKQQVDRVPFPILLDQSLEAVDFFGIRSNLAHPSTYLIDKEGHVQFAYVGSDRSADRPSVKALLRTIQTFDGSSE